MYTTRKQVLILGTFQNEDPQERLIDFIVLGEIGSQRELEVDCPHYMSVKFEKKEAELGLLSDSNDLLKFFFLAQDSNLRIKEVELVEADEDRRDLFSAVVRFSIAGKKQEYILDAASALLIASMNNCPVYVKEGILENYATFNYHKKKTELPKLIEPPKPAKTCAELEAELEEAISEQKYERAAEIREELKKVKTN